MGWATFLAIFSQTHLVTLFPTPFLSSSQSLEISGPLFYGQKTFLPLDNEALSIRLWMTCHFFHIRMTYIVAVAQREQGNQSYDL
jgi:hypothetical protein